METFVKQHGVSATRKSMHLLHCSDFLTLVSIHPSALFRGVLPFALAVVILDPVVSISADSSNVSFNSCGYNTPAGTCVIEVMITAVSRSATAANKYT